MPITDGLFIGLDGTTFIRHVHAAVAGNRGDGTAAPFQFHLDRNIDLLLYAITKKRLLAGLGSVDANQLQFFIAEEGITVGRLCRSARRRTQLDDRGVRRSRPCWRTGRGDPSGADRTRACGTAAVDSWMATTRLRPSTDHHCVGEAFA